MALKPDYNVSAKFKNTDFKGRIGGAWKNDDGTISVRLNAFITLKATEDLIITLFPADEK
jgi:hypothetical protein